MKTYDTYLPTELGKILSDLQLQGRTITNIESNSCIEDSTKTERLEGFEYSLTHKNAEADSVIILTLDDGRKIGFDLCAASHMFVYVNPNEKIDRNENYATITELFGDIIVGKKIKNFTIHDTEKFTEVSNPLPYIDSGLSKDQKIFIKRLDLVFEDNDCISFENTYDFTLFSYNRWS